MKTVVISKEEITLIERLFFQYNATKDIVAFLMSKNDLNEVALQSYMEKAEQRFVELELAKRNIVVAYGGNPDKDYMFTFENATLTYTEY